MQPTDDRPLSALPSPRARLLAFGAIVLGGAMGALIGYLVVDVSGAGTLAAGIGAIVGGVVIAGGVAVVAVLTLRAMGEWKRVNEDALFNEPQPNESRRNPSA